MITRREVLRALAGGGGSLVLGALGTACVIPERKPPSLDHVRYPAGAIPRAAGLPGLKIGAAKIDITPPPGAHTWLAGYGFQRAMREVRDPISACCLYIDDGQRRVALLVADVVGLLLPTVTRIRRLVGNGIEVAVASTHNHQSPDTMGYWGRALLFAVPYQTGVQLEYQRVFERRMAACVALAARAARNAELRFARAEIGPGWVQNLRTPGVFDPAIEVIAANELDSGTPIATLINFGCHPETLGDRSRRLSADFPGRLRARVEETRGGTAVFANGILGGMITPDLPLELEERERSAMIDRLGDVLAERALEAVARAEPAQVTSVRFRRKRVELPLDNALFEYVQRVGLVEQRARGKNGGMSTEVGRIDLGPASLALVPGEPTPKVGLRIKQQLGVQHPLLVALAADELGYILDRGEYADPNFAYEASVSVGAETAPVIEAALASLKLDG